MKMLLLQPGNGGPVAQDMRQSRLSVFPSLQLSRGSPAPPDSRVAGFWVAWHSSQSSYPVVTTARNILASPGPLEWESAVVAILAHRTVSFATSSFHEALIILMVRSPLQTPSSGSPVTTSFSKIKALGTKLKGCVVEPASTWLSPGFGSGLYSLLAGPALVGSPWAVGRSPPCFTVISASSMALPRTGCSQRC